MLYKTLSAAVYGIDASIIEVEVDVSGIKTNEDYFHTVGLPDAAVRESRDRVRAALKNCGYDIPPTHITINLAPADIRKEGSGFDLPMALGILGAYGGLNKKEVPDCLFVGELSLDGGIRGVRGALPIAIEARGKKIPRLIVPELNAREAAMPRRGESNHASHHNKSPRAFHIQHETTLPSHTSGFREGPSCLPRWHLPSNWRHRPLHQ
jgi:magnesium chelatase family protein